MVMAQARSMVTMLAKDSSNPRCYGSRNLSSLSRLTHMTPMVTSLAFAFNNR
jgi:hypothetical protein